MAATSFLDETFASLRDIQNDAGQKLPREPTLQFTGSGVAVADDPTGKRTVVTISGGGGDVTEASVRAALAAAAANVAFNSKRLTGVADPSGAQDAATKASSEAAAGAAAVEAVDAAGTSAATAGALVRRDGSGRARFADPDDAQDAATKGWVEAAIDADVTEANVRAALAASAGAVDFNDQKLTAIDHIELGLPLGTGFATLGQLRMASAFDFYGKTGAGADAKVLSWAGNAVSIGGSATDQVLGLTASYMFELHSGGFRVGPDSFSDYFSVSSSLVGLDTAGPINIGATDATTITLGRGGQSLQVNSDTTFGGAVSAGPVFASSLTRAGAGFATIGFVQVQNAQTAVAFRNFAGDDNVVGLGCDSSDRLIVGDTTVCAGLRLRAKTGSSATCAIGATTVLTVDGTGVTIVGTVLASKIDHTGTLQLSRAGQETEVLGTMRVAEAVQVDARVTANDFVSGSVFAIAENATGAIIGQGPRTSDDETYSLTITSQAPFAGATGDNRDAKNLVLNVPAPATGGYDGALRVVVSGEEIIYASTFGFTLNGGMSLCPVGGGAEYAIINESEASFNSVVTADSGFYGPSLDNVGTLGIGTSSATTVTLGRTGQALQVDSAATLASTLTVTTSVQAPIYKTAGTVAGAGVLRTANAVTAVAARNAANSADTALLGSDSSNRAIVGGANAAMVRLSTTTATYDFTFDTVQQKIIGSAGFNGVYVNSGFTGFFCDTGARFGIVGGAGIVNYSITAPQASTVVALADADSTSVTHTHTKKSGNGASAGAFLSLGAQDGQNVAAGTNNPGGSIRLIPGAVGAGGSGGVDGSLALFSTGSFGGGGKVVSIANATTVPTTNPSGGGLLYSDAGAGKWRGSSGTVTTFGPAEPHCPTCVVDFTKEWRNDYTGDHLVVCEICGKRLVEKFATKEERVTGLERARAESEENGRREREAEVARVVAEEAAAVAAKAASDAAELARREAEAAREAEEAARPVNIARRALEARLAAEREEQAKAAAYQQGVALGAQAVALVHADAPEGAVLLVDAADAFRAAGDHDAAELALGLLADAPGGAELAADARGRGKGKAA